MTSKEFAARLERRVAKADVSMPSSQVVTLLEAYYSMLSRWNARINLTSLALGEGAPAAIDRLLVEPLAAARHVPEAPIRWVDLGSGGGSPAIPLKIVRPAASLTMVEATTKKATFLKEVIRELQLADAAVENIRIEDLADQTSLHASVHLVTARALRLTNPLFETIRLLLKAGGRLHVYTNRPPELPPSSGFTIEAIHKLGNGLDTKLVILQSVASEARQEKSVPPGRREGHVSRGTSARPRVAARRRLPPPPLGQKKR
jgi:16S rRNA (guanine527-N7)-methyltransferase